MDLLLSMTVSLPTSRRPICLGSILYLSRRDVTALKLRNKNTDQHIELHENILKCKQNKKIINNDLIEMTSSSSVQKAKQSWPSPMVYLPLLAPS